MRKKTHEEFIEQMKIKQPNLDVLSHYVNSNEKVNVYCKIHDFNWWSKPSNLLSGFGCSKCGNEKISQKNIMPKDKFLAKLNNQHRGNLILVSEYTKMKDRMRFKCLICGHEYEVTGQDVLLTRDCPKCYVTSLSDKMIMPLNEYLEKLSIKTNNTIELVGKQVPQGAKTTFRCKLCGYIFERKMNRMVTHAENCPNCDRVVPKNPQAFKNKVESFGIAKVIGTFTKVHDKVECECVTCGNHYMADPYRLCIGHGCCDKCIVFLGEKRIKSILDNSLICYETQKKYFDLRGVGGGKCSYDFYVPNYNLLIEFQGKQHYEPIKRFGGEEQFEIQQEHDKRKREYAKQHGIDLLCIRYDENVEGVLNLWFKLHRPKPWIKIKYIPKLKCVETAG